MGWIEMLHDCGYERCPDEIYDKCDYCKEAFLLKTGKYDGSWPYIFADHLDTHCECEPKEDN